MTRKPFPEVSLAPPEIPTPNFGVPQMQTPQMPMQQSNLTGQVNQLGQILKIGQYGNKSPLGGIGGGLGGLLK